MKAMKAVMLNALASLSLLISIAMFAGWIRSHWSLEGFVYRSASGSSFNGWCVYWRNSAIEILRVDDPAMAPHRFGWHPLQIPQPAPLAVMGDQPDWNILGVSFARGSHFYSVGLPFWLLALVTFLPPIYRFRALRRRRQLAMHCCCKVCGYDLRATPQRCPECGTVAGPGRGRSDSPLRWGEPV
jgi:hypothetical protein